MEHFQVPCNDFCKSFKDVWRVSMDNSVLLNFLSRIKNRMGPQVTGTTPHEERRGKNK